MPSYLKYLAAGESRTSTTTPTAVTALTLPSATFAVGEKYTFMGFLIFGCIQATPDFKIDLQFPTQMGTNFFYISHFYNWNTNVQSIDGGTWISPGAGHAFTYGTPPTQVPAYIFGSFEIGGNTTINDFLFKFAQNTSSATASNIFQGSWIRFEKV